MEHNRLSCSDHCEVSLKGGTHRDAVNATCLLDGGHRRAAGMPGYGDFRLVVSGEVALMPHGTAGFEGHGVEDSNRPKPQWDRTKEEA